MGLSLYTSISIRSGFSNAPTDIFLYTREYVPSPQNDNTIVCSTSINALVWPPLLSNLTTTNKVRTAIDIDEKSHSFATPINNNHSATESHDRNNTTDQVKLQFNLPQCQQSTSNQTTSLKLLRLLQY